MKQYRVIYQQPGQSELDSILIHGYDKESAEMHFNSVYPYYDVLDVESLDIN